MVGRKERRFREQVAFSLEEFVPADNFYREVETRLDLSFVPALVQDAYVAGKGRPSIDPVVFFKLQLILFFEGLRSERQLMETVHLHLAHRWYIGYDLDEVVPDHSSLSRIRARYGLAVFQRFFEQIVEQCIEAGLVAGRELYFDGTKVRANAAMDSLVPRWYWEEKQKQHLRALFAEESPPPRRPKSGEPVHAPARDSARSTLLRARAQRSGTGLPAQSALGGEAGPSSTRGNATPTTVQPTASGTRQAYSATVVQARREPRGAAVLSGTPGSGRGTTVQPTTSGTGLAGASTVVHRWGSRHKPVWHEKRLAGGQV